MTRLFIPVELTMSEEKPDARELGCNAVVMLPVGTRIVFIKSIYGEADDERGGRTMNSKPNGDHEALHDRAPALERENIALKQSLIAANEMLEFFFGQMQMHSPKMNGQHSYRFRGGWPMTHCVGPNAEAAVKAAIQEIKREREQHAALNSNEPRPNGIACPECGKELVDSSPNLILTSNPPQTSTACPECGYTGRRVVTT